MSSASEPLLRQTNRDPAGVLYGSASDSELQANGSRGDILRYSTQIGSSADDLSLSLSPEKTRTLQEKALQLRGQHPISNFELFVHLVKANVGPGMLGLPKAIKQSGLVLGPVLLFIIGICATWCIHLLVKCSHTLSKRLHVKAMDYGDTAFAATLPFSQKWAVYFRHAVNFFLLITQFGCCCVYFIFISSNLLQILYACGVDVDINSVNTARITMALLIIPFALVTFIRNLDYLAPLSSVANISLAFSVIAILYFDYTHLNMPKDQPCLGGPVNELPLVAPVLQWPLCISTAVYTYESIGLVLPLENKMKRPIDFQKVMLTVMTLITVVYIIFSTSGYLCFGSHISGSIPLNLPTNGNSNWVYSVVKLYLIFAVTVSFALQIYVPIIMIEPVMLAKVQLIWKHPKFITLFPYILRVSVVAITAVLAIVIPRIDLFMSLIGAFSSSCLALIFPPIMYIMTFYKQKAQGVYCARILCIIIAIFGIVGSFGFGTYSSLTEIVKFYRDGEHDTFCIIS